MPASEPKKLPGIFISYRRSDTPDAVGRIYDRLVSEFGKARVFKDVDSIPLGQDFRGHLNDIVGGCAAVLAIIGPKWTDIRNEAGLKRLEDPDDFVRIELEAALARSVPVVPVLVGHAPMPGSSQLPTTLASLAFRQSIEVRPDPDFHNDATRLVVALKSIIDPNASQTDGVAANALGTVSSAKAQLNRWIAWGLAGALVLAAMLATPALHHLQETPPPETRLDIVTPATDDSASFALSPDGKRIVFVAKGDGASRLWLRPLSATTAQPLAGTEGATAPFWSPNSRSIAFFAAGGLTRLDLDGGAPRVLVPEVLGNCGTWNSEGVIVFSPPALATLWRVSADGGKVEAVTKLGPNQTTQNFPQFLPDGRHLLFHIGGAQEANGIYLGALDGSAPVRLTDADSGGVFLSPGWLVFVRTGALMAQRFDLKNFRLSGKAVTLSDAMSADFRRALPVSASANGVLAFRAGNPSRRQLTWVDRSGAVLGTVGDPDGTLAHPRVSPDGGHVVVSRMVRNNTNLWLLDGPRTTQLTFDEGDAIAPVWSPDGTRIAFGSSRSGGMDIYQKLASGAGTEEQVVRNTENKIPTSWSPDGHFLLYFAVHPKQPADLWAAPISGDSKPVKFPIASQGLWGQFSPNGRWVAYTSYRSGPGDIYVTPFHPPEAVAGSKEATDERLQVSTEGGIHPMWRADGKELYFINSTGEMMAVTITLNGSAISAGLPVKLFPTRILGGGVDGGTGRQYDVAPDGRFLINRVLDSDAPPITLIQNWNPDAGK